MATVTATLMIAQQIGAKSLRDTLFLVHFPVSKLPVLTIAGAVVSLGMVVAMSWILRRYGPRVVAPGIFFVSAVLYAVEWELSTVFPRVIAISVFLHTVTFGASATSSFWSMINERFDPHAAKRVVGTIGTGATFGGLLGGVAVWLGVKKVELETLLLFLVIFNGVCGALLVWVARGRGGDETGREGSESPNARTNSPDSTTYLRTIGAFVVLSGLSLALFDYVFKARAAERFQSGAELAGFFALFYTVVGAVTFVVQTGFVSRVLVRFGLTAGLGVMPGVGLLGGVLSALFLNLPTVSLLRGFGTVAENSFFRSSYELLYTPLSPSRKRSAKLLIDVGGDRVGTSVGGGVVLIVLGLFAVHAERILLFVGAALTAILLGTLVLLHRGYVRALADSMRRGTADLHRDEHGALDSQTVQRIVNRTLGVQSLDELVSRSSEAIGVHRAEAKERLRTAIRSYRKRLNEARPAVVEVLPRVQSARKGDPVLRCIVGLRSDDLSAVRAALRDPACSRIEVIPHLIALLERPEVSQDARGLLEKQTSRAVGQFYDVLVSPRYPIAVRRQIAHILATAPERRSGHALERGLRDSEFEVRHACAVALHRVCQQRPALKPDRAVVFELIDRELERRDNRRFVAGPGMISPFFEVARDDAPRAVIHVFTLLALVLDHEPLLLAFRTLTTPETTPTGTALEYLDNVLPPRTRVRLNRWIEGAAIRRKAPLDVERARRLGDALRRREMDLGQLRAAYREAKT